MTQLLILNPNTSASFTAKLSEHVRAALPQTDVQAVTARLGAPYIASEASYAVAGHAVLDSWAAWRAEHERIPDAVLIGCFGDPGLFALRECCPARVTGLAEAAFTEATQLGRFAVVTGGERWAPMLERLAQTLGLDASLAGVHTVEPSGAQLAADPAMALKLLAQACRDAARQWSVSSIILGGAGLAGLAAQIQADVDVPVIDSVLAGARYALLAKTGLGEAPDRGWIGVAPELSLLHA